MNLTVELEVEKAIDNSISNIKFKNSFDVEKMKAVLDEIRRVALV